MSEETSTLDYRDPDWVAAKLGLEKNTVYKFLQDGVLPAVQIGRKWLISEARLAEWLRQETDRQTAARQEAAQAATRVVRRLDDFAPSARLAIKQAHSEARRYGHAQLGQEHLLLGLVADASSPAARALQGLALDAGVIRQAIELRTPPGSEPVPRRLGRTADAKRAMRIAAQLAERRSGGRPISAPQLLMGILLSRQGLGCEILRNHRVTHRRLKQALAALREPHPHKE